LNLLLERSIPDTTKKLMSNNIDLIQSIVYYSKCVAEKKSDIRKQKLRLTDLRRKYKLILNREAAEMKEKNPREYCLAQNALLSSHKSKLKLQNELRNKAKGSEFFAKKNEYERLRIQLQVIVIC